MGKRNNPYQVRSAARRKALQLLYQEELSSVNPLEAIDEGVCIDEVGVCCDFTRLLLGGTLEHSDQIDELITQTSQHWTIDRMPLVDRAVLRLAIFEMLYVSDVPHSVSINEAVELAKEFGGEDGSSKFVNGILGRIAKTLVDDQGQDLAPASRADAVKDECTEGY